MEDLHWTDRASGRVLLGAGREYGDGAHSPARHLPPWIFDPLDGSFIRHTSSAPCARDGGQRTRRGKCMPRYRRHREAGDFGAWRRQSVLSRRARAFAARAAGRRGSGYHTRRSGRSDRSTTGATEAPPSNCIRDRPRVLASATREGVGWAATRRTMAPRVEAGRQKRDPTVLSLLAASASRTY